MGSPGSTKGTVGKRSGGADAAWMVLVKVGASGTVWKMGAVDGRESWMVLIKVGSSEVMCERGDWMVLIEAGFSGTRGEREDVEAWG